MSLESKRKLKAAFDKYPAWAAVDGARRVDAFCRASRALTLGKDRGKEADVFTWEQIAALRLCDRSADIFDPVLGISHAGTNQEYALAESRRELALMLVYNALFDRRV